MIADDSPVIAQPDFIEKLTYLNAKINDSLKKHNLPEIIGGNLFYEPNAKLDINFEQHCASKRRRFTQAVNDKSTMFEIGINGGHSSLLALMSEPKLAVYANDLAKPFDRYHPEIYTLVACEVFPDRFNYVIGDCLQEVPKFVQYNAHIKFDIIHIDGAKETYTSDIGNLTPSLLNNAIVIVDDYNIRRVKSQVDALLTDSAFRRLEAFPDHNAKYTNIMLEYHNE